MSVTFNQLRSLTLWNPELGDPYLIGHSGSTFYNFDVRVVIQHYTLGLTSRIDALEQTPGQSYWPTAQSIVVDGAVSGHARWDGSEPLQLNLEFSRDAIGIDTVRDLAPKLLELKQEIDEKVGSADTVARAHRVLDPFIVELAGDVQGRAESADHLVNINTVLSESLQQQLDSSIQDYTQTPITHAKHLTRTGLYYLETDSDETSGLLLHMQSGEHSAYQTLYTRVQGLVMTRSIEQGNATSWSRLHSSTTLPVDRLAKRTDGLAATSNQSDFNNVSASHVANWTDQTKDRPQLNAQGTYLEFHSADGSNQLVQGNTIYRLTATGEGQLGLATSVNGAAFNEIEFWSNKNFEPKQKADVTNARFNRAVTIAAVETNDIQPILNMGRAIEEPNWQLTINADNSLTLNAIRLENSERYPIMSWSSRHAGGQNQVNVHTNRFTIGGHRKTSVYGFTTDSWGMFSTNDHIGWGDAQSLITAIEKKSKILRHDGAGIFSNVLSGVRVFANWDAGADGAISCDNWFRSSGDSGWMSATYGGGWYMTDFRNMRCYNDKRIVAGGFSLSLNDIPRSRIQPVEFNGYFQPIQFMRVGDSLPDYGVDLTHMSEHYPFLIEQQPGYVSINVNGVVSVMSAQINHLADEVERIRQQNMALNERNGLLKDKLVEILEHLGLDTDIPELT